MYNPYNPKTTDVKYATQEDVDKAIKKIDLSDIKDDIKTLKKQVKDLRNADE